MTRSIGEPMTEHQPDLIAAAREGIWVTEQALAVALNKVQAEFVPGMDSERTVVRKLWATLDAARVSSDDGEGLDAAWAEAEAALPEGTFLGSLTRGGDRWYVQAFAKTIVHFGRTKTISTSADTPAAALQALAAKLRADR